MKVKHFFSLKQDHTIIFFILAVIMVAFGAQQYSPLYGEYALGGGIAVIIGLMFYMELGPHIYGKGHPHMKLKVWKKGDPPRDWDFDVYLAEVPEEAERVVDIFALMETDPAAANILRFLGGRFWYPYLVPVMTGPEFPTLEIPHPDDNEYYRGVEMLGIVLPHPWTKFLNFTKRENGAYITGTEYTHPASVSLETILSPFKLDFIGNEIPILIGVSSSYTIKVITKQWTPSFNELARNIAHFDEIIEQEGIRIFPEAELNETLIKALPKDQQIVAKQRLERMKAK